MEVLSALDVFRLRENPFSSTPPDMERPIVWAGREPLKQALIEIIQGSFISSPSRININWGEWGAGKTHSMKYFSQEKILEDISKETGPKKGLSIMTFCPRENVLESLYILILKSIGLDRLRDVITKVIGTDIAALDTRIKRLKDIGVTDIASKVFLGLVRTDRNIRPAAERYIFLETTTTDLKYLNIPRRIGTKVEQFEMLAEILRIIISKESGYSRIFIWIDEMESIQTLSGRDLTDMRTFLRSVIDLVPYGLTIMLNATLLAGELSSFLDYLGPAVRERIYKITELPTLDESDAIIYVEMLLNSPVFRSEKDKRLVEDRGNSLFPFDKEAIETIYKLLVGNLKRRPTPRNINDALSSTMEYAIRDSQLIARLENLDGSINSSYIQKNWEFIRIGVTSVE